MKEIGGYFELGGLFDSEYHASSLRFSSARNALKHLIEGRKIRSIQLPRYLCDVIYNACVAEGVQVNFYDIDPSFLPLLKPTEEYVYIVNYFGQLSNRDIKKLKKQYNNIIVDNTHSFFQKPLVDIDTIYNCRKYFGVPDGAYLYTSLKYDFNYPYSKSSDRCIHLLGRLEETAGQYYKDFQKADVSFDSETILGMSKISKSIMGAIDYKKALKRRKDNFKVLNKILKDKNQLKHIKTGTYMYPFYVDGGSELRQYLIQNKIYIPILWPNVLGDSAKESIEYLYAFNLLPLPIDQRYDKGDMAYVIDLIEKYFSEKEGSRNE